MIRRRSPAVPRQRWRSWLVLLGLVFAVSAVLRLGALDLAWALDGPDGPPSTDAEAGIDPAADGGQEAVTRILQAAIAEVETLRQDLDARATALAAREAAVDIAQSLVEARLAELAEAETRLADLIAISDAAAETDLDRLTRVYETMPPDTAAVLFERMPPSFAAGFLARMTPAASAALMAALTPEQGYAVSVVLATRNSSAPRMGTAGETGGGDTER